MTTAADWQHNIKPWGTSWLTQAAYCRRQGLNPTTFSGWVRRDRAVLDGVAPGLLPIQFTLAATGPTGPLVLRLASGHAQELPADGAPGWLAKFLRCLG